MLNIACWCVSGVLAITAGFLVWLHLATLLFAFLVIPLVTITVISFLKAILNTIARKNKLAYNADLHRDATWLQTIILPRHAIDLTYNEAVNLLVGEVVGLNGPKNVRFQGFLSFKESLLDGRLMYTNTVQEAPVISSTAN